MVKIRKRREGKVCYETVEIMAEKKRVKYLKRGIEGGREICKRK